MLTNVLPQAAGQVFAFIGAKGGVGASTLAVNTAAALGRESQNHVLLIDLHTGHGDAALFLGVEPRFSVLDALENIHRVDESFFSGVVEKAVSSVHLLASPTRPRPGGVDPKRMRALLESAAQMYRTTVLDVPRSDMTMIDSLDHATTIVVVTSQEICVASQCGQDRRNASAALRPSACEGGRQPVPSGSRDRARKTWSASSAAT